LKVDEYAQKWGLTDLLFVGETSSSQFHSCNTKAGESALLKVLTPLGLTNEGGGFALLAQYDVADSVAIYDFEETAAVMERLTGPRLMEVLDQIKPHAVLDIQLDVIKRLFRNDVKLNYRRSWADLLTDAVSMTASDAPDWDQVLLSQAQQVVGDLFDDRTGWRVLHGDLHPRNILQHNQVWRVIDAQAVFGPPEFEFANLFINPWDRPDLIFETGQMERVLGRICQEFDFNRERIIQCAVANALYHAHEGLKYGNSRHPLMCIAALLALCLRGGMGTICMSCQFVAMG